MADWVLAVERAYVAAASGAALPITVAADPPARAQAIAAAGAVASRFLAVGTPRSFGIIIDGADDVAAAALALTAHRTWFAPRDVRCASTTAGDAALATATNGRVTSVDEALACDIVNVYASQLRIAPTQLRRGTHVNARFGCAL